MRLYSIFWKMSFICFLTAFFTFGCVSTDNHDPSAQTANGLQNQASPQEQQTTVPQSTCTPLEYQIMFSNDIGEYKDKDSKIIWVNSSSELNQYTPYYPVAGDDAKHSYFEKINTSIDFEKDTVLVLFAGHHDDGGRIFSVDKACAESPLEITLNEFDEGNDAESSPMLIVKFLKGQYEINYQVKSHPSAKYLEIQEKNKPVYD